MAVGVVEIVVLLLVCAVVIAALRKPSWVTLLALPFGLLLLLGIGTVMISMVTPRVVAYRPATTQWVEHRDPVEAWDHISDPTAWSLDGTTPFRFSSTEPRRVGRLNVLLVGVPLLLSAGACATVLALKRKWIAQHASVVLPLLAVGFAGVLAVGGAALYFVRMEDREAIVRDSRRAELHARGEALRHGSASAEVARSRPSEPAPLAVHDHGDTAIEESNASSEGTATSTQSETAVAVTELPEGARGETVDWRKLRDGVHQNPVVLVSDQWSSVQESEIQLEAMAARALQQQLLMDRGSYRWQPSRDFVHQSGAIQQRFVEQTSLKVGEFDTPMFRSYWQVSATPHVSELAQQAWKAAAVEERLTLLGAGAAVLTLLFAGGAAGLRFDSATGGRYRRRMAAATVVVGALAAGTAALFVA